MQGEREVHGENRTPIKLFAFDLDGTALSRHRALSEKNREALLLAGERGVLLVPATGRIRSFLPEEITALPGVRYAVTSNGGAAVDLRTGRVLHSAVIPHASALLVQEILREYPIYVEYYVDGAAYTLRGNPERARNDREFPASKHHFLTKDYRFVEDFWELLADPAVRPEKINLPYLPEKIRSELALRLGALPGLKLTSSIPDNLEVNSAGATKGQALRALCDSLGLRREECMAIGDNGNDEDMLRWAGISVAMGNASQEAMEAAAYATGTCEEDGLAEAVRRFLL